MAGIYEDYLTCKNCDGVDFEVKRTIRIRSEAKRMKRLEDEFYPSRFVEENKVIYKCTTCGAEL